LNKNLMATAQSIVC